MSKFHALSLMLAMAALAAPAAAQVEEAPCADVTIRMDQLDAGAETVCEAGIVGEGGARARFEGYFGKSAAGVAQFVHLRAFPDIFLAGSAPKQVFEWQGLAGASPTGSERKVAGWAYVNFQINELWCVALGRNAVPYSNGYRSVMTGFHCAFDRKAAFEDADVERVVSGIRYEEY